jgi:uncharacterized protein (TIGR02265 family)
VAQDPRSRALAWVGGYCDLEQRLAEMPPSARIRGLYFTNVLRVLRQAGRLEAYQEFFRDERWSALRWYSLSDYLVRLGLAGAVLSGPAAVHAGMRKISQRNVTEFHESLLGRMLLRILSKDPLRLAEQAVAGRRQSVNYGEWRILRRNSRELEIEYRSEYIWIESAITGAAEGTFAICDLDAKVETVLESRYDGSTFIRW